MFLWDEEDVVCVWALRTQTFLFNIAEAEKRDTANDRIEEGSTNDRVGRDDCILYLSTAILQHNVHIVFVLKVTVKAHHMIIRQVSLQIDFSGNLQDKE